MNFMHLQFLFVSFLSEFVVLVDSYIIWLVFCGAGSKSKPQAVRESLDDSCFKHQTTVNDLYFNLHL